MEAIADMDMMWTCSCNNREWNHYQWCAKCGKERPEPLPEAKPSDISRPDPAPIDCGYDDRYWLRRYRI